MATISSGVSEKVAISKETSWGAGTTGATQEAFGIITSFNFSGDTHTTKYYGMYSDIVPTTLVDGVLSFSGSMDWIGIDGRELACIMGSVSAPTGAFTLGKTNVLPSYVASVVLDGDKNAIIRGLKFTQATISLNKDEVLKISANWLAKNITPSSAAISVQKPTDKPLIYLDGYFEANGTKLDLDRISITINRQSDARRGIAETAVAGEERLITSIIEKTMDISGSGTGIANIKIFEELMGGTSLTQYRDDVTLKLVLANSDNELEIDVTGRLTTTAKDTTAETGEILYTFNFIGQDIDISGDEVSA
jgi:hypothetical protein